MLFFRPTTESAKNVFLNWSSINGHSLNRNEHCWKTKHEKSRAQCFSTMQCEMKCFSHTKSTSSSQSTNYYALCSSIFHLCVQLLHGSKNTKLFPTFVLFLWKWKIPFSFLKCYHIVFQGKSTDFQLITVETWVNKW